MFVVVVPPYYVFTPVCFACPPLFLHVVLLYVLLSDMVCMAAHPGPLFMVRPLCQAAMPVFVFPLFFLFFSPFTFLCWCGQLPVCGWVVGSHLCPSAVTVVWMDMLQICAFTLTFLSHLLVKLPRFPTLTCCRERSANPPRNGA